MHVDRVRNGFVPASRRQVFERICHLVSPIMPFANLPDTHKSRWGDELTAEKMKECVWLRPEAVAQIEFLDLERIRAFFDLNTQIPVTVQSVVAAVEQMRDQMKWCSPAQLVAKQTGFAQAEALISILGRRSQTLDPAFLLENATVIAQYLLINAWSLANIDQAIGNISQSREAHKLHFVRRLQDREREILAEREKNRADLEANRKENSGEAQRLSERAKELMHPELRLSEKARAHREMLNRPPQKVQVSASAPEYSYWKSRCESAIASLPVMDRAEAQQLLDAKKGGSYESAYSFIMTFVNRRAHERANAASLARMGR